MFLLFLAQRKIAPRLIIESIINEEDLELEVTAYFGDWRELKGVDAGAYGAALWVWQQNY